MTFSDLIVIIPIFFCIQLHQPPLRPPSSDQITLYSAIFLSFYLSTLILAMNPCTFFVSIFTTEYILLTSEDMELQSSDEREKLYICLCGSGFPHSIWPEHFRLYLSSELNNVPQCIYATFSISIISLRIFSLFHFLTRISRYMDKKLSVEWDVEACAYMPRIDIAGPQSRFIFSFFQDSPH